MPKNQIFPDRRNFSVCYSFEMHLLWIFSTPLSSGDKLQTETNGQIFVCINIKVEKVYMIDDFTNFSDS